MNKVYNNQTDIARGIAKFLKECSPNIRKTQLNIIPYITFGMMIFESLVPIDIAKRLKEEFSLIQIESIVKRINRLFKNKYFQPYDLYDQIIRNIINNYKVKHNDNKIHIVFDHMFSRDNYTVFMMTMRVGNQGIPIWFRCFEGKEGPEAFREDLIKEGISYVSNLFDNKFNLVFLADRWFNSIGIMEHINLLGHTYVLRLKKNIKVFHYDYFKKRKRWKNLDELPKRKYLARHYKDIEITEKQYKTTIVISDSRDTDTPWILATNGSHKRAIIDYGYRFGGIETVFKNQKSNGFYIENTVNASLKYFESMYFFACFGVLLSTIIGTDYSKNTKCYKHIKIKTHTISHGKKIRIKSLFQTGLTLFQRAFNSLIYIRINYKFILYDI